MLTFPSFLASSCWARHFLIKIALISTYLQRIVGRHKSDIMGYSGLSIVCC